LLVTLTLDSSTALARLRPSTALSVLLPPHLSFTSQTRGTTAFA